jgi:hypothetical protein
MGRHVRAPTSGSTGNIKQQNLWIHLAGLKLVLDSKLVALILHGKSEDRVLGEKG